MVLGGQHISRGWLAAKGLSQLQVSHAWLRDNWGWEVGSLWKDRLGSPEEGPLSTSQACAPSSGTEDLAPQGCRATELRMGCFFRGLGKGVPSQNRIVLSWLPPTPGLFPHQARKTLLCRTERGSFTDRSCPCMRSSGVGLRFGLSLYAQHGYPPTLPSLGFPSSFSSGCLHPVSALWLLKLIVPRSPSYLSLSYSHGAQGKPTRGRALTQRFCSFSAASRKLF